LGLVPRLCAIGICLLLALQSAVESRAAARRPSAGSTVPIVVAARALPGGHVLTRADLRLARWPESLRPAGAKRIRRALIGRRLAGAVGAREPLLDTRLLGPGLADQLPPGLVATAVAIADRHVADLVRPGDRIDLLGSARADGVDDSARPAPVARLARASRVLAVFGGQEEAELVLAVPRPNAASIARKSAVDVFTVVLTPP
jgi:Flp pilus assembly protein CpaB